MNEYIDKIHEHVNKLEYENEDKSAREIFLEETVEYIRDVEDTTELILSPYDNEYNGARLDGFDLLRENEIILYVSDYSDAKYKLLSSECEELISKVKTYVVKSHEGLSKKLNSADSIYDISDFIYQKYNQIEVIHIFLVSSCDYNGEKHFEFELNHIKVKVTIFDATFFKEHGYLLEEQKDDIVVQLDNPAKFVKCPEADEKMDVYMIFLEGKKLAEIYGQYGYRMLEGNVRAYLKKTNKQNSGILSTIENEPDKFVAYNNGLSTVADSLEFENDTVKSIKGWKIVNGGQTTATIYEAYKNKEKLRRDIFVPIKITVLKKFDEAENKEELISKIAEYANTQNKISQSDLNSNEKYHIELEKLSRTCCVPTKINGKELRKWFYERLRGQYTLSKERALNEVAFFAEFPDSNVFDKMDIAKAVMMWEQEPFTTAGGKEKCFGVFNLRIKANEGQFKVDEEYYKKLVALVILYRGIAKVVKNMKFGGFGSNIVEYTGALISMITNKKLDLLKIWDEQKLSDELLSLIEEIATYVADKITQTPEDQKNVQMYCRQKRCWDSVKNIRSSFDFSDSILTDETNSILESNSTTIIQGEEVNINKIDPDVWGRLSKWGKETNVLTPSERKMAFSAMKVARNNYEWKSDKQKDFAKSVYIKACAHGFLESE